jgi:hypothetical protein
MTIAKINNEKKRLAEYYKICYNIPHKIAYAIANQRLHEDNTKRGNSWQIFEVECGEAKYLCHLKNGGRLFYTFHDIETGKKHILLKKVVKMRLVEMRQIVELTRKYEYVERLVYGKTATQYDMERR